MARSGLTGGLSPVPAGRACSRALPQRASRTEMPLPRHPSTRPDGPRPTTKGHALEASPQRLHANVRMPHPPRQQITNTRVPAIPKFGQSRRFRKRSSVASRPVRSWGHEVLRSVATNRGHLLFGASVRRGRGGGRYVRIWACVRSSWCRYPAPKGGR